MIKSWVIGLVWVLLLPSVALADSQWFIGGGGGLVTFDNDDDQFDSRAFKTKITGVNLGFISYF